MADEDIQPLVCDNGSGMVKVSIIYVGSSVFGNQEYYFAYQYLHAILYLLLCNPV